MTSSLSLEYEFSPDGDDFGWLIAQLETPDFSGRNGMWVQWQDLVEFGEKLVRYPIDAANPIVEEWGFSREDEHTMITRIKVAPSGNTGGLICNVSLANYYEPQNRCRSCFATDYPALGRFRDELAGMMRKECQQATLVGIIN
jgi:hypothetical protein